MARAYRDDDQVDFVELFNPGNFTALTACAQDLNPGIVVDISIDPQMNMRVETYRTQAGTTLL